MNLENTINQQSLMISQEAATQNSSPPAKRRQNKQATQPVVFYLDRSATHKGPNFKNTDGDKLFHEGLLGNVRIPSDSIRRNMRKYLCNNMSELQKEVDLLELYNKLDQEDKGNGNITEELIAQKDFPLVL